MTRTNYCVGYTVHWYELSIKTIDHKSSFPSVIQTWYKFANAVCKLIIHGVKCALGHVVEVI